MRLYRNYFSIGNADCQDIRQKLQDTESELKKNILKLSTLEKSLDVYQQAFYETPYMMHAVDSDGKILMANKREHDVLGYKEGELVGKNIFDIYSPPMHGNASRGLKIVIEKGHHHLTYTSMLRKDGSTLRCDIASSSLLNDKGDFLSTITVLRPIDPEELLRSLNGVVDEKNGPMSRYSSYKVAGESDE